MVDGTDGAAPVTSAGARLVGELLRHRRLIVGLALLFPIGLVALVLPRPRDFTALVSFMPTGRKLPTSGGLAGLAAQFGVDIPGGELGESPAFYADLLRSANVLRTLVGRQFTGVDGRPERLAAILEARGRTAAEREADAVERLRRRLTVTIGQRTGVVALEVTMRTPTLARDVASALLDEVDRFNKERRQTQAASERRFAESRVAQARTDLRAAEDRMQRFLANNRTFDQSTPLEFERQRLDQDVRTRQQVYTSLVQAYEQARLDEVRDTPVVTIVEQPVPPARPDPRYIAVKSVLAALGGALVAVWIILIRTALRASAAVAPEDLRQLLAETRADIRRPWRLVFARRRSTAAAG